MLTKITFPRLAALFALWLLLSLSGLVSANDPTPGPSTYFPLVSRSVVLPPLSLGLDGGPAIALAIDPQVPTTIYAGTYAGMFKSTDSGANWAPIRVGFGSSQQIMAVAVDPHNSNIVYASAYKDYLYKSSDGGATWAPAYLDVGKTASVIYSIAFDPFNSQRLYLALRLLPSDNKAPWNGFIYRSDDGGGTWASASSGIYFRMSPAKGSGYYYPYSVVPNPYVAGTVYAAFDVTVYQDGAGMYQSSNYGANWTEADRLFPTNATLPVGTPKGRDIAISHNYLTNGQILYYAGWGIPCNGSPGKPYDILRSYLSPDIHWNVGYDCGVDYLKLAMTQTSPYYLYASTQSHGLRRIADALLSEKDLFTLADSGLPASSVGAIAINPLDGKIVYAGAQKTSVSIYQDPNFLNEGIYKTTNGNDAVPTWALAIHGLNQTWVTGLYAAVGDSNRLFMASYISGIFQSTDLGANWTAFNTGMPTDNTLAMVMNPAGDRLFALTNASGLYTLNLSAGGWTKVSSSPSALAPTADPAEAFPAGAFPAGHPFAQPELPDADVNPPQSAPRAPQALPASVPLLTMSFAPSSASTAYIGTSGSGVYKSLDGGTTWNSAGLPTDIVTALAVDPSAPDTVYAVACTKVSGACPLDAVGLILYSLKTTTNAGTNWTTISLPTLPSASLFVYSVTVSPVDPTLLYVGTSNGIYTYAAASSTWTQLGLAGASVTVIAQSPLAPGRLYAGTTNGAYFSVDAGKNWTYEPTALTGLTITSIQFDSNNPTTVLYATKMGGGLLVR